MPGEKEERVFDPKEITRILDEEYFGPPKKKSLQKRVDSEALGDDLDEKKNPQVNSPSN